MGLSFLNKKTWHPGSFANIEKVWIAEQKRREQERKIIENSKKLKEERQIEELKKLQVEAGLIPSSHLDRLDWIYQGPESNSNITTAEEVLLGKPLKDDRVYKRPIIPVFQESYSNPQNEIFTKIHEDPLFVLKKEEMKARKEIEENPYRMKMLLKEIEENIANNQKKEKKKKKKDKKEKKDKKKSRKRSYSRSKSSSRNSRGSKDRRKHSYKNEKPHDEKDSRKEITTTNMLKNKLQGSTQNFGLLDGAGKKISLSGNDLGPDEKLYKNRKELAEKESEFRQPKRDNSYRNLSEKDKERMRYEMENRAKSLDHEKIKYLEEKTKNIRETSKSKLEKLNLTNESKNISLLNKPGFLLSIDKDVYMSGDLKLDDRIKRNKVNMEREKY